MKSSPIAVKTDADYQAESDAHTLTRAEEVKLDKGRHSRARKYAAKQAKVHLKVAGTAVDNLQKGFR